MLRSLENYLLNTSNKLGYPKPSYLKETPLAVEQISIVCHKNAKTKAYIESINPHVLKLVNSGRSKTRINFI